MALCRTCEVQGACLAWALDVGDCHGVWGGTTPRERRAMLVAWRAVSRPEDTADTPPATVTAPSVTAASVTAPVVAVASVTAPVVAAAGPVSQAAGPVPVSAAGRAGRRLGLVPEQRSTRSLEHRQADSRRTDGDLAHRVAS
jgi:hypothetical protein